MKLPTLLLLPLLTGVTVAAEGPAAADAPGVQPTAEIKPDIPEVPASGPSPTSAAAPSAPSKSPTVERIARPASPALPARLLDAVAQKFPYVPKPGPETVGTSSSQPAGEVVVLPPVTVTDSADRMSRAIEETFRKEKAEEFNWTDGGRIYRNIGKRVTVDLDIKFHPEWGKHGGWSFLSISR